MRTCAACGEENPDRFRVCGMCGADLPIPDVAGETRKTVTVLFADVTGSTTLGERLDPESLRAVMSRFFERMQEVVERHGGTVAKLLGDAIMAVFGIPSVHEDDALRAVRAATDMHAALTDVNRELSERFGVALGVRIGVNTGEVLAGNPVASQDLVIGDAVNVAARLEEAAGPGETVIGRQTWRLVRDGVRAEPIEPLALKGKSEPVQAYRLLEVLPGAEAVARHLDVPMVGRERQLGRLLDAFESAAADRSTHLVTLLGPPGVGKSRLAEELVNRVRDRAMVVRGRCLPYGEGITYWPVIEIVTQAAGLTPEDGPDAAIAKILDLVRDEPEAQAVAERVAETIGAMEPGGDLAWAIRAFLEALARARPLVAVFDDIHWAEPMLLDLIEHVGTWSRDAPILLVCMARPDLLEARPAWAGGAPNAATLTLEPLSEDESERLIDQLLGAVLDPTVRSRVASASEGNPLFAEELVSMLLDDGRIRRENGHWAPADDLHTLSAPPTIQALLAARVDRLPAEERVVLERASVVGTTFNQAFLDSLVPDTLRAAVPTHLRSLLRRDLIRPDRDSTAGPDGYRFRHLLIRDAAYERLPKAHRAQLHEAVAAMLEGAVGQRAAEVEEIVGYHLERAVVLLRELGTEGRPDLARRAAEHLAAAGHRAYARADGHAASNLLGRAAALLPLDDPERVALLPHLGAALGDIGALDRARATYEEAARLGAARGDLGTEWHARVALADLRYSTDPDGVNAAETRAEMAEAIRHFEALGHHLGLALASFVQGKAAMTFAELRVSALQAIEHARMAGRPRQVADGWGVAAFASTLGTTPVEDGIRLCEAGIADAGMNLLQASWMLTEMAGLLVMVDRVEEAEAAADRGAALQQQLGYAFGMAGTDWFRGTRARQLGRLEEAHRLLGDSAERMAESGERLYTALAFGEQSHVQNDLGRFEEALATAERAQALGGIDVTEDTTAYWLVVEALLVGAKARALGGLGRFDEAEALGREAVALVDRTDALNAQGEARLGLAEILEPAGRSGEALDLAADAADRFYRKGNLAGERQARAAEERLATSV
jgi:class 3 adenylate cyclase/tetratricopeptide (TPR) repeat protein